MIYLGLSGIPEIYQQVHYGDLPSASDAVAEEADAGGCMISIFALRRSLFL